MTNRELLEKAAHRFRLIADDTNRITSGNLSHNLTCLRGFALRAAESIEKHLQEEPVSEDLEEAVNTYIGYAPEVDECSSVYGKRQAFKAGALWQKEHLWKPDDSDNLPEIDREVIALTQPYPNDEHLKVVFAHRPNNKYAKVWNSDLGKEQIIEIEWFGKGEWNIPFVKYWLDAKLPYEENKIDKEIEL